MDKPNNAQITNLIHTCSLYTRSPHEIRYKMSQISVHVEMHHHPKVEVVVEDQIDAQEVWIPLSRWHGEMCKEISSICMYKCAINFSNGFLQKITW
jgi:hypothetical protein